jgi:hypothetical protein
MAPVDAWAAKPSLMRDSALRLSSKPARRSVVAFQIAIDM